MMHFGAALLLLATVCCGDGLNYWGRDYRMVPPGGRIYTRDPEYYYTDEGYSNEIGQHPVYGGLASYPASGRPQWRHGVVVPKRSSSHFHDGSHLVAATNMSNKLPLRRTTGLFRSSQWGSATIPYAGAKVNVPVLSGNKKAYKGTITTTILRPSWNGHKLLPNRFHPNSRAVQDAPDPSSSDKLCIRCPDDRAVVATKGTSFVLVEPPAVKPCHDSHMSRLRLSEMRIESIFGPQPGTTIGEGSYNLLVRLTHNGRQVTVCKYRYHVTVQKCPPLHLPRHVDARCALNNVWGSRCDFTCPQGFQLIGHTSAECGDKLRWTNPLPHCKVRKGCPQPLSPVHGRLSCETPGSNEGSTTSGTGDLLEEGTICRYECDAGYSVPSVQAHLSVIRCRSHSWNNTVDPSCQAVPNAVLSDSEHRHPLRHHRRKVPCRANPCHGGGTCLVGPHSSRPVLCLCPPDREGEFCERGKCEEEVCENGGRCIVIGERAVCYCPPGFTGQHCQHTQVSHYDDY